MNVTGTKHIEADKTACVLRSFLVEPAAHDGLIRTEDMSRRESSFETGAAPGRAIRFAKKYLDLKFTSDVSRFMRLPALSEPRRSTTAKGILCPGRSQMATLSHENAETVSATLRLRAQAQEVRSNV